LSWKHNSDVVWKRSDRERERERACRSLFYDLVAVKIDKLTLSEMDQKLRDGSKSRERDKEGVA
jgi:hypothetical protein